MSSASTETGGFRLIEASPAAPPVALLSGQGRPASEVWTCAEWSGLCMHLHNLNDDTRFVMGFRKDGAKEYVKSKRVLVARVVPWSWDSICGRAKSKVAFVPYSQNGDRKSRWGAFDFDAHDGNAARARGFAFEAFKVLLNVEGLFIILESTGSGGWHVWAVTKEFHGVNDWVRLLKGIAFKIGAPIEPGICEIFPPDGAEMEFGKGVRAPGCWNPSTDSLSEVFWHNTEPLLGELVAGLPVREADFHERKKEVIFSSPSSEQKDLYPLWYTDWRHTFHIDSRSTRNTLLTRLVGTIFHQVGCDMARRIVEAQFTGKVVSTEADLEKHLKDFRSAWAGLQKRWLAGLSDEEREAFGALVTDNERDAFRIVRSFERKASLDRAEDFPIVRDNLADRLGISGKGAAWIRDKLEKMGVIRRTKVYQPNKAAARYCWTLARSEKEAAGLVAAQPF